jgi:putative tryptophan/tyrosine transport system substrate-binding protein
MEMALFNARRTIWTLCFCIAQWALAQNAAAQNIAIVISEETPTYLVIADMVRRLVTQQAPPSVKLFTIPGEGLASGQRDIFKADFYSLIVTVGARAAAIVSELHVKPPVLCTLIPRALYERLPSRSLPGHTSAIFLDQPLSRQLELVRLILPGKVRLGVIYAQQSAPYWSELERQAQATDFSVVAESIERANDIGPALQRIFARADFLFAVPDAEIFNRMTIPKILLSSYHSRRPVIAFSAALVKSGALAAVFTAPEHLARHIAEIVLKMQSDGKYSLPPPQYPIYWSVSVNRQVANSLGLSIPNDQELQSRLSQATQEHR